jgi:hypothetical protein
MRPTQRRNLPGEVGEVNAAESPATLAPSRVIGFPGLKCRVRIRSSPVPFGRIDPSGACIESRMDEDCDPAPTSTVHAVVKPIDIEAQCPPIMCFSFLSGICVNAMS